MNIAITREEMPVWCRYIKEICGIHLDDSKGYLLETRLASLLSEAGASNFSELFYKVRADASGKLRGVYGINVKTALGDRGQTELKVEPFGNVRRGPVDRPQGEDIREPLVDIHEEDDHVLVLVELPGVAKENVTLNAADARLEITAGRGKTTYRKDVELPKDCSAKNMSWECSNGILQVRFDRKT